MSTVDLVIKRERLREELAQPTAEEQLRDIEAEIARRDAEKALLQEAADAAFPPTLASYIESSEQADIAALHYVQAVEVAHDSRKRLEAAWRSARTREPLPPSVRMKSALAAHRGDHEPQRLRERVRDAANTAY